MNFGISKHLLSKGLPLLKQELLPMLDAFQTRAASKMAGGATKNRKRGKKTPRGIKVEEGQEVQRQTILCTQLQLRYYPGQNVKIGTNMTLNAMVDGKVLITKEKLNPYPDSPIYSGVQNGEVIERVFVHVLPFKQENRFRLISLV
ncbi:MRPL27 [Bugula neritina]|uniref:MRPL27 n=1 Tax=Bugula neritina TaxID=10212 RepID=A0A7J7IVF7_BUGNE|nr:MRPL27 [Bugula neritina]